MSTGLPETHAIRATARALARDERRLATTAKGWALSQSSQFRIGTLTWAQGACMEWSRGDEGNGADERSGNDVQIAPGRHRRMVWS